MRKALRNRILALAVLFAGAGSFAYAQFISIGGLDVQDIKYVSEHVEDDDSALAVESPVLWIKYVGSQESGTLDINVNAIELFAGPLGSETISGDGADVNTGDVCAATNNSLDVTDAQCDTPEELCSVINAANANWVCALGGVLGSETLATAAEYVDMADAQAKLPGGFGVTIENGAVDTLAALLRPDIGFASADRTHANNLGHGDIEFFLREPPYGSYDQDDLIFENPFGGQRAVITSIVAVINSTGAWTLEVYARRYRADGAVDERLVYSTTDTADATDEILDFSRAPLISGNGETFLVRISDDALVTGAISVNGFFFRAQN